MTWSYNAHGAIAKYTKIHVYHIRINAQCIVTTFVYSSVIVSRSSDKTVPARVVRMVPIKPPRWVKIFRFFFMLTREFVSERSRLLCLLNDDAVFADNFACFNFLTWPHSDRINLPFAILIACTCRCFDNFFKRRKSYAKWDLLRLRTFDHRFRVMIWNSLRMKINLHKMRIHHKCNAFRPFKTIPARLPRMELMMPPPRWVSICRFLFTLTREFISVCSFFLCLLNEAADLADSFACFNFFTCEHSDRINLSLAIPIACTCRPFGNFFKRSRAVAKWDLVRLETFDFLRVMRLAILEWRLRAILWALKENQILDFA